MVNNKELLEELKGFTKEVMKEMMDCQVKRKTNYYRTTEKRLYAYPKLKRNIERYKLDIEDVKREDFGKSKDIVKYISNYSTKFDVEVEDLREAKILTLERKMHTDQYEVDTIEKALEEIQDEEYYEVIRLHYFEHKSKEDIAQALHCAEVTTWRQRKRLVQQLAIALYGADAVV